MRVITFEEKFIQAMNSEFIHSDAEYLNGVINRSNRNAAIHLDLSSFVIFLSVDLPFSLSHSSKFSTTKELESITLLSIS